MSDRSPGMETQSQIPRLTTMLRAFATDRGAVDVNAEYLKRQTYLQTKRQAQPKDSISSKSTLALSLLGDWASAPKAAREEYEHFVKLVSGVLGGEGMSGELQATCEAVWEALCRLPSDLGSDSVSARLSASTRLKPFRDALVPILGALPDKETQELVEGVRKLRDWQATLGKAPSGKGKNLHKEVSSGRNAGSLSDPLPMNKFQGEFGAELDFKPPRLGPLPDEAMPDVADAPSGLAGPVADREPSGGDQFSASLRGLFAASGSEPGPSRGRPGLLEEDDDDNDPFAPKKRAVSKTMGARWVREWCKRAAGGGPAGPSDDDTVAVAVCRILLGSGSGDAAAAELFDLFGDSGIESIQELLENRKLVVETVRAQIVAQRRAGEGGGEKAAMPSYGTTVSITSRTQKALDKLERKDKKRVARGKPGADLDIDWLNMYGVDPLVEAELLKEGHTGSLIVGDLEFRLGDESTAGRTALPKGTTRKNFKGYEEVRVPGIRHKLPDEAMVQVSSMPEWAQLAFQGYKSLNRIQSRIFPTAFESNQNLLVCAPTGAGKTNIAMIAVLREVGANMDMGVIQKSDFKIVYVAPMKALAAEVTSTFSRRLAPLGLVVRELTGDMQLTKKEITETQMIVTTPEKWDVITRKGGDVAVAAAVRLLIIDEVHLLNDDRGPVIETLIARTQRQVEASQSMIRIVGLSATLPNYKDVASFLGVSPESGLFHFDASYRPVPLDMQFIGVSEKNIMAAKGIMDEICYQKVVEALKQGHQAMVFVHSRKDTGKTARTLGTKAQNAGDFAMFDCREHLQYALAAKDISKSRNREMTELFPTGIGIHHAGMLRSDRSLMERLFADGLLKVLCCTATLAWGVNLPAHTVIIKGTQVYNPEKGGFTQLGMLDVQQIFGRAGRPQYEDSGEGIIITQHGDLAHYLGMLTHQIPIESQFVSQIVDNLNAEIVLGTVTNVREAAAWLGYTYLFVRMQKNPLAYGVGWEEVAMDPRLEARRRSLIVDAARELERCKMARFDERSGLLYITELGRVASHYYIKHSSIVIYNELLKPRMNEAQLLSMLAQSSEFENMQVREDELPELDTLAREVAVYEVRAGPENKHGKVNILLQAYISRAKIDSFSLIADMNYVSQNAPRICRAVFEIAMRNGWALCAELALTLCKAFELRLWPHQHVLRQFGNAVGVDILNKLEDRELSLERLRDMEPTELAAILRSPVGGRTVASLVAAFPTLHLTAHLHPLTRTVVRVVVKVEPGFEWRDGVHGPAQRWHVWVEDLDTDQVYHTELWSLTKRMIREGDITLSFTIPVMEPPPSQLHLRMVSDTWLGAETVLPLTFRGLILPEKHPPHTELLDLDPLPVSALDNPQYEQMYRFSHFNPIQTQAFHTLYHTDDNVLLGAPTGSGKTISAELTMMRLFRHQPGMKVIYIAPLKALVKERMKDWREGLCARLGKKLVELTGDFTPDMKALMAADVIIATPEKWDGISRSWANRAYARKVGLLIIDEIHLLGADRGPVLEVIVSRMRYISSQTALPIRFVGLSTALANAVDLADWLGIPPAGLFNFKPSVRPVPLEVHIQGYPTKLYCPRMATMNKPAYAAIQTYSPLKPVLIFVSSRRQTRLTALDLLGYAAADERPRQFVHMPDNELDAVIASVKDSNLRHTLQFGIGLHHAGLPESDRTVVETLYVAGKIQVLVATSTLAWGVNTPAHLVIVKGTEFFDAPTRRYVDFPITDVLQMMGRAGRPQYDQHGVAVIMVHQPKKAFYKKFLYEPFPVESSLPGHAADHMNAEIVSGTVGTKQEAVTYLTWTFFYRRLLQNPSYYDLPDTTPTAVNVRLSKLVEDTLLKLQEAGCVVIDEDDRVTATGMGRVGSMYYLRHQTLAHFARELKSNMDVRAVLDMLCGSSEYDELPVRHNEDRVNAQLAGHVRWALDLKTMDDPHTKANLLLQAHMGRVALPMSDYITDTRSTLDNSVRILHAILDVAADAGLLFTLLASARLIQGLTQGRFPDGRSVMMLPGISEESAEGLAQAGCASTAELVGELHRRPQQARQALEQCLSSPRALKDCIQVCERLPLVSVSWRLMDEGEGSPAGKAGPLGTQQLEVQLKRTKGKSRGNDVPIVYAPLFPKVTEEGWWLVLGVPERGEVLAFSRLTFGQQTTSTLRFTDPGPGSGLTLFLLSGPYLGLDQEHVIRPHANPPPGEKELYSAVHPVHPEVKGPDKAGPTLDAVDLQPARRGPPPGYAARHLSAEERGFMVVSEADYDDEPSTCG